MSHCAKSRLSFFKEIWGILVDSSCIQEKPKLFSVIVPIYNEAAQIQDVVHYLMQSPCPIAREWIFVDDCSSDNSRDILVSLQSQYNFKLIAKEHNEGKGAAIMTGIQHAQGDFIGIQDADFEYDVYDVPDLLLPLLNNSADVVFGSRFKKNAFQVHRTYHYFVNRLLTVFSNLLSGIYLTDMETCYKIFRADLLKSMNLRSQRFGIEVELTAYLAKTSARIFELPITYYPRHKLQGKKINWKDGVAALWHLWRFNMCVKVAEAFTTLPAAYNPEVSKLSQKKPFHYLQINQP